MSFARQIVKRALAAALPRERFLVSGPNLRSRDRLEAPIEIALTFDDGPHPQWTPAVLDELALAGWTGTFFVIGERAAEHPDLLRRIVAEGHTVGNHTYTHSSPCTTSATMFREEVQQTQDLIRKMTGVSTSLMRPPLGKLDVGKFLALWKQCQTVVLWNVDPKDFAMTDASDAVRWSQSYLPARGDVILLHDRLPYAPRIVRELFQRWGDAVRSVPISRWLTTTAIEEAHAIDSPTTSDALTA